MYAMYAGTHKNMCFYGWKCMHVYLWMHCTNAHVLSLLPSFTHEDVHAYSDVIVQSSPCVFLVPYASKQASKQASKYVGFR